MMVVEDQDDKVQFRKIENPDIHEQLRVMELTSKLREIIFFETSIH